MPKKEAKSGPKSGTKKELPVRVAQVLRAEKARPIPIKNLAIKAKVSKTEQAEFNALIGEMKQEGQLYEKKSTVILAKNIGLLKAEVISVLQNFGFVRPTDIPKNGKEVQDIFIPGRFMLGAVPGDIVLVRPARAGAENPRGPEGAIVRILKENNSEFSAVVIERNDGLYVTPDKNLRISLPIDRKKIHHAKVGDKVRAKISYRADGTYGHRVEILNIFGSSALASSCAMAILETYQARRTFDPVTQAEANLLATQEITRSELEGRLDLTELPIFTIDSEDSKDLDDAISLEQKGENWLLGVHIADVSHYVRQGTSLDKEAYARGTSVYYADQVIPMLPQALSNGICSLNPDELRLTFSALVTLAPSGELLSYRFVKSFIRSRVKGIYKEVNAILAGNPTEEVKQKYEILIPEILKMKELADILTTRRFGRGALNIESTESKFIIENGLVTDIKPRTTGNSERMIEEFMLTANEAAASLAMEQNLPFVYRVHDKPPAMKLETLHKMLNQVGLDGSKVGDKPQPKDLSNILEQARGTDLEAMVNTQLLRTMAKAIYSEQNIGHFGLVLENYAHFTSPIRRYPDLMIHRILSAYLSGSGRGGVVKQFRNIVAAAAKSCSTMELNAMNIERDCEDCYKAEYMSHHIGEELEGIVSGVTAFGVYVQLPNTVEGLVHVRNLPHGEYSLEESMELVEKRSGTRYRMGQKLRVKVVSVDVSAGQIDFVLAEARQGSRN